MLSPAVRAAAHAYALDKGYGPGGLLHEAAIPAYLTGYSLGLAARPERVDIPLGGQAELHRLFGAYLGEGIDVYHPHSKRYGKLKGLPFREWHEAGPVADVEFYCDAEAREEGCGDLTEPVGKLLPVLYSPAGDLATEMVLADGKRIVPAVEVAILLFPWADEIEIHDGYVSVFERGRLTVGCPANRLLQDRQPTIKLADWLHQHHFATPSLEAHQYHRRQPGFDYASGAKPAACLNCQGCEKGKEVGRA